MKHFHIIGYLLLILQLYVLCNTLWFVVVSGGSEITPFYVVLISTHLLSLLFFVNIGNKIISTTGTIAAWLMAAFYLYQGFYDLLHIIFGMAYIIGIALLSYHRWSLIRMKVHQA